MTRFHADLLRIILAQIFLHACMSGVRVAAPLLALQEGASALTVGLLMALFSVSQVFLSLPAGRFTDRRGLHLPVRWSIGVAVAAASLVALWPGFPMLCLAALGTGAAVGVTVISLQRHVGRMAHDEQALRAAFSWLSVGPAISNFVGPVIAGLLIDHAGPSPAHPIGFRMAFGVLAVLPLITWWIVHQVKEHELRPVTGDEAPRNAVDLLRSTMMQRLLLINWIMSSCWDIHSLMIPVLGHERGFSASAVGTVLGSFAVAVAAVRLILPWLSSRVAEYRIVTWAMALSCLAFCLYPFMPDALSMGLCSVFLGVMRCKVLMTSG